MSSGQWQPGKTFPRNGETVMAVLDDVKQLDPSFTFLTRDVFCCCYNHKTNEIELPNGVSLGLMIESVAWWQPTPPKPGGSPIYLIAAMERPTFDKNLVLFWKANRSGYTIRLDEAGRYSQEEATEIVMGTDGAHVAIKLTDAKLAAMPVIRREDLPVLRRDLTAKR